MRARHAEPADIVLRFDRERQRFTTPAERVDAGTVKRKLADLWSRTPAAGEDDGDGV